MNQPKQVLAVLLACCSAWGLTSSAGGSDRRPARFEGEDTLLRPGAYREWVFVGSSLGLRYSPAAEKSASTESPTFGNVYLNPAAYRQFQRRGTFPEGTVLVLEIASATTKREQGLQGTHQQDFTALEVAVKDSRRFKEGWAYFSFDGDNGRLKDKATPFPRKACFECHHTKAATDHVFTQFYPVLRAIQPPK